MSEIIFSWYQGFKISWEVHLDKNRKDFCNLQYMEILYIVARKFDLKDGNRLIRRDYADKKAASYFICGSIFYSLTSYFMVLRLTKMDF
jgi:hypothetical protein